MVDISHALHFPQNLVRRKKMKMRTRVRKRTMYKCEMSRKMVCPICPFIVYNGYGPFSCGWWSAVGFDVQPTIS